MSTKNLARTVIEGGGRRARTREAGPVRALFRGCAGVLRRSPARRHDRRGTWLTNAETQELRAFAGDRKIRHLGAAYFWLEMTFVYRWTKGRGLELQPTGRYRQTGRLTDAETARFTTMSLVARANLLDTECNHAR